MVRYKSPLKRRNGPVHFFQGHNSDERFRAPGDFDNTEMACSALNFKLDNPAYSTLLLPAVGGIDVDCAQWLKFQPSLPAMLILQRRNRRELHILQARNAGQWGDIDPADCSS